MNEKRISNKNKHFVIELTMGQRHSERAGLLDFLFRRFRIECILSYAQFSIYFFSFFLFFVLVY